MQLLGEKSLDNLNKFVFDEKSLDNEKKLRESQLYMLNLKYHDNDTEFIRYLFASFLQRKKEETERGKEFV